MSDRGNGGLRGGLRVSEPCDEQFLLGTANQDVLESECRSLQKNVGCAHLG